VWFGCSDWQGYALMAIPTQNFGVTKIRYFPNRCELSLDISCLQQAGGSYKKLSTCNTSENSARIGLMEIQAVLALIQ